MKLPMGFNILFIQVAKRKCTGHAVSQGGGRIRGVQVG